MSKEDVYLVHYCFTIKDPKKDELSYWERDVMEVEASSLATVDTGLVQQRIKQMAESKIKNKKEQVIYANYHKIEKKAKRRGKKK